MPYRTPHLSPTRRTTLHDLTTATLLAATGGMLDAITYLNHGHVFANAMTGNVIFLGISALSRNWTEVLLHLAPVLAFLAGVFAARLLNSAPIRHSALLTLSVEIVALFAAGLFPLTFSQVAFTATVSFVSAFQVTTFRRVGRFTYNSTYVTGNLREIAEGFFDHLFARDPAQRYLGRARLLKLAAICLAFLFGAAAGAIVAPRYPAHALWFAEPTLLAVLLLTLLRPVRFKPSSSLQRP